MSLISEELLAKVLILPIEERVEIAHRLLQSLESTDSQVESSWNAEREEELSSRLKAYREGKIEAIDMDDAMEMIRPGERP